ncbi:MAG: signal peptidase I [Actinomycetota bacterium]|nr:signal peptidase I [Actinomycetota bacterium]
MAEESFYYWEEGKPKSRRELRRERQKKKRKAGLAELVITIVVAFALVFGIVRPFVVEAYRIPSESMVPTLEVGDRVLANKFIYRFTEPDKGDIVVFDSVDENDDQTLIKRVVGKAGDEIQVQDGVLYVNDEPQEEPYLNEETPFAGSYGPTEVPDRNIFVMGDNRGNSADSRVFGPLPLENLKGEAFARFWPVGKIGGL